LKKAESGWTFSQPVKNSFPPYGDGETLNSYCLDVRRYASSSSTRTVADQAYALRKPLKQKK